LLPLARRYIFDTRKKGYTVDITNILLYFYKYVYQRAFSKKKLKSFLRSNILSQADIIFSVDIFNVLRERLLGPVYNRWSFLVMNKVYRWLLRRNSFKFVSVERKKLWSVYNLKSVINSMNGVFYLRAYYFLFFRKIFRKLRKHLRRKRVRVFRYKHLYDPVFLSFYKKKKKPFFLFTLFKSKRWNICLENKTSRIFLRESKLKRPAYKTKQFKRVKIIRQLQSNRSGTRRRRSLFRVKKHVFKFLDQYLYANVKRFKYLAKRTNADFDFVAFSFYNNMSFLLYRLGVIGTLSASLSAVKCHWFCLDFELVTSFTSLVSVGSIITLYPSLFVFSAFVWYRNFFIRQSYKRAISNKHFIVAKQPFFVFVFCKKYKSLFIYNKFELIKPFVLKNLKMI
jgi:hypothetical protein